ncbi:hypothetical protein K7432_003214 [Basidiobolus ranarum]|uniref:Uncharacterized protein n=1 Tax=Basidiobolus ranarum TaxID=34480 RepID=A0ABR2W713_9FUNG
MHPNLNLLFISAFMVRVSVGVPLSASSSSYSNIVTPRSNQLMGGIEDQFLSTQQPSISDSQSKQFPLLNQLFGTVARKYANLNHASVNNQGKPSIGYQFGPNFGAESTIEKSNQGGLRVFKSNAGANIFAGLTNTPQETQGDEANYPIQSLRNLESGSRASVQHFGNGLGKSLPQQALVDRVQHNSAQTGHALSDSNQFDQMQRIDQTLYQPSQPVQDSEPPQTSDEQEPEDSDSDSSSSDCRGCGRRYRGRRRRFGRRY